MSVQRWGTAKADNGNNAETTSLAVLYKKTINPNRRKTMGQTALYDLRNNSVALVSIPDGSVYTPTSDVNGDWKDCSIIEGTVQALCSVGTVNLGATAQSVNFELEEADDAAGLNAQKVSIQTEVTLTADKTANFIRALTTKPFCRVIVQDTDSSLTGGTTPTQEVAATIVGQKKSF